MSKLPTFLIFFFLISMYYIAQKTYSQNINKRNRTKKLKNKNQNETKNQRILSNANCSRRPVLSRARYTTH